MPHYCRNCKRTPDQVGFSPDLRSASGLDYRCKECRRDAAKRRYNSDPKKHHARTAAWRRANPERYKAMLAQWIAANAERVRSGQKVRSLRWYAKNGEKARATAAQWRKAYPARVAANNAMRDARQLLATPKWADPEKMRALYEEARHRTEATGIKHHVDHVVPLRGKTVSGLHWEGNLEVIHASVNVSKKHLYWPGM